MREKLKRHGIHIVLLALALAMLASFPQGAVGTEPITPASDADVETSLADESNAITLTSFDCSLGHVGFETSQPLPGGAEVEIRYGSSSVFTEFLAIPEAGPYGQLLTSHVPREGNSIRLTAFVRALSEEGPTETHSLDCDTPDWPDFTILDSDCNGAVWYDSTGPIDANGLVIEFNTSFRVEEAGENLLELMNWPFPLIDETTIIVRFNGYIADSYTCPAPGPTPEPARFTIDNVQFRDMTCEGGIVTFDIVQLDLPPDSTLMHLSYVRAMARNGDGSFEPIGRYASRNNDVIGNYSEGDSVTYHVVTSEFYPYPEAGAYGLDVDYDALQFDIAVYPAPGGETARISNIVECNGSESSSPTVEVNRDRAPVGSTLTYSLRSFPRNTEVTIAWQQVTGGMLPIGSVATDGEGAYDGSFVVPATPGGAGHEIQFTFSDDVANPRLVATSFSVAPIIRSSGEPASSGDLIELSMSGLGSQDNVRVRWFNPNAGSSGAWVQIGAETTSPSGSIDSLQVIVPDFAIEGLNRVRVDGAINAQTNNVAIVPLVVPVATINPERATVNSSLTWTVEGFPVNTTGQIMWRRLSGGTIQIGTFITNGTGEAAGSFKVPATPGGPGQLINFIAGEASLSLPFVIAPRIKVTPSPVGIGNTVDVSLRGFARQDVVRIRWFNPTLGTNGQWVEVTTVRTSNTGSANVLIPVPFWAPIGANKVRVDGMLNGQTNVVQIEP